MFEEKDYIFFPIVSFELFSQQVVTLVWTAHKQIDLSVSGRDIISIWVHCFKTHTENTLYRLGWETKMKGERMSRELHSDIQKRS